ncbi:MAG TPA: hypothetical protein VGJ80_09795, partial [Gemmatimonadales bacterium]
RKLPVQDRPPDEGGESQPEVTCREVQLIALAAGEADGHDDLEMFRRREPDVGTTDGGSGGQRRLTKAQRAAVHRRQRRRRR